MAGDDYQQHVAAGGAGAQGQNATASVSNYYGRRPHAIEEFPAPTRPAADWLEAQPSRLLDARSQVVPFLGREPELHRLREWCDSADTPLSVLLLHGPAGQGKTRLATEFVEQSRADDLVSARRWRVLQARLGSGVASAEPVRGNDGEAGILLVVDYADRWAHSELVRLLTDPLLRGRDMVRVLLIGRSVRWYAPLRGQLNELRASADDFPLTPLTENRLAMFETARDRFAQLDLYDLRDAASVGPPGALDDPDFGLPLTLHMAALVSVDARKRGNRAPSAPHELSAYLLDREYLAWQRLSDAGQEGQDYRTRPSMMAKAVFAAVLTGAVSHEAGTQALRTLDVPGHPEELLADHRLCYPPPDRGRVLEPLYPDRLAEDFLALLTPGHDITGYDPDPWATAVPGTLLGRESPLRLAIAPRALLVLAAAADRWPHLRAQVLHPLLTDDPDVAMDAGSAALTTLAEMNALDPAVLDAVYTAIESRTGGQGHIDLDVGIAAVAERVVLHRLDNASDTGRRLDSIVLDWTMLSSRFANAGQPEKALAATQTLVATFREAAEFAPDLIASDVFAEILTNLGVGLARLERWEEALDATDEAIGMLRTLVESDPGSRLYHNDLAGALGNSSGCLLSLGRAEEALTRDREALAIARELAAADPDTHVLSLARALSGIGVTLSHTDHSAAIDVTSEAVALWRPLAQANPTAHLLDLAAALATLGRELSGMGRHEPALEAMREAAAIRRRAATANPAAHLPTLAASLTSLDNLGSLQIHPPEAQASREENAAIYRSLADASAEAAPEDAQAYLPGLVEALRRQADDLGSQGEYERACAVATEAVAFGRQLAGDGSFDHLYGLAASLGLLRRALSALGRHSEAADTAAEVVAVTERMVGDNRDTFPYALDLARSLGDYADALVAVGEGERAAAIGDEVFGILNRLREQPRSDFLHRYWLAALDHRGRLRAGIGAWRDAMFDIGMAVGGFHAMVANGDTEQEPSLRAAMSALRDLMSKLSTQPDALELSLTAASLYTQLGKDKKDWLQPCILTAQREYFRLKAAQGQDVKECSVRVTLAWRLFSELDQRLPGVFSVDVELCEDAAADVYNSIARSVGEPALSHDDAKALVRALVSFAGQAPAPEPSAHERSGLFRRARKRSLQPRTTARGTAGFGCTACYGTHAEAVARNHPTGFEQQTTIEGGSSHFGVSLQRCRECSQMFVGIFTEFVDWLEGKDAQYWILMPVTENEATSLRDRRLRVDDLGTLGEGRRHLHEDLPAGADKKRTYWDSCRFQVVRG